MSKIKNIIYILLIICLFGINNIIVSANEKGIPYINPEWEEYIKLSEEEKKEYNIAPEKYIVDYVDTSGNVTPFNTYGTMATTLPEYFNLRDNYATPIYNQGNAGLCWAYTTATTVESHLKRTKGITRNISVKQMDYLTNFTGFVDSTYGIFKNPYATRYYDFTTNTYYIRYLTQGWDSATSFYPYLATGASAMTESAFGIYNNQPMYNSSIDATKIVNDNNIEYQVTEYVDFPNYDKSTAMINLIKEQIYNYGALYIDSIAPDYRSGTCYDTVNEMIVEKETCENATVTGRHAMAIIGWDDSYAGGKGAFILQNSWGEGSYAEFPHLSYQSIIKHAHGIKKMVEKTWDNNYDFSTEPDIYMFINNNRVLQGEPARNLDHTSNYRTDVVFDKSPSSVEKLHSINFESDVQNGIFDVCISTTGDLEEIENKENCQTVTSELPGLITIDYTNDDLYLSSNKFIVSIIPENSTSYFLPSVNAFTNDTTTSTIAKVDPQDDIEFYEPYDPFFDGGYAVYELKTYTTNIPDGKELTYKLYNSNNSLVSQSSSGIKFYNRGVYNNSQRYTMTINNTGPNGLYRVDVLYNNQVYDSFNIYFGDKEGTGTIDDPYIIKWPLHVAFMDLYGDKHYKLGKNIDMTPLTKDPEGRLNFNGKGWDPITDFTGSLDGNNYTLSGLYINRPEENNIGLFSEVTDSSIKNLKIKNFDIAGKQYVGTLFGKLNSTDSSKILLSNIEVSDSKITGESTVGGLVGTNYHGNLDNINGKNNNVTATLASNGLVAGLIGSNVGGTLTNMIVDKTTLKAPHFASGIVGSSTDGVLNNIIVTNSTLEADQLVGGVIALSMNNEKTNLKGDNNTFITTDAYIGGLVGDDDTTISNSYSINSTFTGNNKSVIGGIVGSTTGEVKNSYTTAKITGGITGGIVGTTESSVTDSYSISDITGETVGGIIGKNTKTSINNRLYHFGDLNGTTVGGIIGIAHSSSEVNNVFNVGNLNNEKTDIESVGGIVGNSKVVYVNNAYYIGDVPIKNNYSAGGIFGFGPCSGSNLATIYLRNTYYASNAIEEISFGKDNVDSVNFFTNTGKKSTTELKDINTFTNFDFNNIWEFKNTNVYPTLKSIPFTFVSDVITDNEINLIVGTNKELSYTITPNDATIKDIEFINNNKDIITLTDDGLIKANSVGKATITIKSKDKSINKDITVNVLNKSIKILDDFVITPVTLYNNATGTITFNIELNGISSNEISYKVINKNTNEEIKSVSIIKLNESVDGTKTIVNLKATIPEGMSPADYKIIAISSIGNSNDLSFKINKYINVNSITLNKNSLALIKGETEELVATILPNNAMNKNIIWTSSNDNIATVNNGKVTAVSRGTATITASTVDGNKTSEATITVMEPTITIGTINYSNSINSETKLYKDYTGTIVNSITSQDIANNTTLTVTIKDSSNTDITNKFVISGNTINNNSATITINVPNTLGNGTYTVEIKANDILKSYQFLIHNPIYVTGIEANDIEIEIGNTTRIIPTITPTNAFNKNVIYKSNNTNVATVDANGLVTGISGGTTEIVITAADNNKFSKTINVKVNGDRIILEEESDYQITDDENDNNIGYIDNIKLERKNNKVQKITVRSFIDEFSTFNAKIKNSYGELIEENDYDNVYLGTGSKVIVGDKTYNIIVKGDVNGDANINAVDAYAVLLHYAKRNQLTGVYMSAGDVDQNPNLTIVDAYQILLFYSGRKESL